MERNLAAAEFLEQREQQEVIASAGGILKHLDLRIEDLAKYEEPNSVVDLGCGKGDIGRAASMNGTDSVVSIYFDQETPNSKTPNVVKANALEHIPLETDHVGLLISRNGPHLWNFSHEQATSLFMEINRILRKDGEGRFHVPWLGFKQLEIAQRLKDTKDNKFQGIWNQLNKPTDWRGGLDVMRATPAKLERVKPYLVEAMLSSTKFLQDQGFNLRLVDPTGSDGSSEGKFWLLKKNPDLK